MPLTDTMLRKLKSDGTPTKLADSEGLYLYLSATGGKLWRMDYRFDKLLYQKNKYGCFFLQHCCRFL